MIVILTKPDVEQRHLLLRCNDTPVSFFLLLRRVRNSIKRTERKVKSNSLAFSTIVTEEWATISSRRPRTHRHAIAGRNHKEAKCAFHSAPRNNKNGRNKSNIECEEGQRLAPNHILRTIFSSSQHHRLRFRPHAVSNNATEPVNREMPLSEYCSHLAIKRLEDTSISMHVFMPLTRRLYDRLLVCCHCRCAHALRRTPA